MIRKYQLSDTDKIIDIWYRSSSAAHPFLTDAFMAQEKINIRSMYLPNTISFVYEHQGELAGFISMMGNEVGAIFVDPQFHGKGIGTALMNHVAELHEVLEVEVFKHNKIGLPFYRKYGFTLIKESIHEPTNHALYRMKFVR